MRRDICYFFAVDVQTLYNAYLTVAQNDKFRRSCGQEPYHTLSFGLNFSMKYNFNGGACTLRFIPCQGGSAVNMRFSIAQAAGARYEKYAKDLTDGVTALLGIAAMKSEISVETFLAPENKAYAPNEAAAPQTAATPQVAAAVPQAAAPSAPVQNEANMKCCANCGKPVKDGDKFCSGCGQPVATIKRFCTQCGKEAPDDAAFCSACGNKL